MNKMLNKNTKFKNILEQDINNQILKLNNITEEDINRERNIRSAFNEDTSYSELFSEGQIKLTKFEFQQKYGIEDKFVFLSEEDGVKTEVNGYRGIIKTTDKENKEVTSNYFDTLDYLYKKINKVYR